MKQTHCTECGKVHPFPEPRFAPGETVLLTATGYHHNDRVGQWANIVGVVEFLVMPCDQPEYVTTFGPGAIKESRLEKAAYP